MQFSHMTPWPKNYAARFRPMTSGQVEAIELALFDAIKATPAEIALAVASICTVWSQESRNPNVNDIAIAIRQVRGDQPGGPSTPNAVTYQPEYMGPRVRTTMVDLKRLLNRRPPPDDAWSIICTPVLTEQSRELMEYCDERGIAYRKFVIPNTGRFRALVRHMDGAGRQ